MGVIPLSILFIRRKAFSWNHPIVPFIWLTGIASVYEFIVSYWLEINTSYWFQLYALLSFLALYHFFSKLLKPHPKTNISWFLILFLIVYATSFFFWDDTGKLISSAINRAYITIFIIIFTVIWFKNLFDKLQNYTLFDKIEIPNLWQSEVFYFISGVFIYYSTTFFLFLSSNFIFSHNAYFYEYWIVNVIATLFLRALLIISVWKMKTV